MFARYVAALAVAAAVLTPLRQLLWRLAYGPLTPGAGANAVLRALIYVAGLAGLWLVAFALTWLARRLLMLAERWQPLGLEDLDVAVPAGGARVAWIALALAAIASAALWGNGHAHALIDAFALAAAAALGLFGRIPGLAPLPGPDPVPEPPAPLPAPGPTPEPAPDDKDSRMLRFEWFFAADPTRLAQLAQPLSLRVLASLKRYAELRARPHDVHQLQDYVRFVREGLTPEVESTAGGLRQMTREHAYSHLAEINNVLAFAQSFHYLPDVAGGQKIEYPKFPLETLVDDGGDCEDHAILAVACLRRLGYDARLVQVDYGTSTGHMALAVRAPAEVPEGYYLRDEGGRKYYYCEVTTDAGTRDPHRTGFRLGEIPPEEKRARLVLLGV